MTSSPRTPLIGLGCVTFGREIDEATSGEIMDFAVAHGIKLFDTAESYGGGQAWTARKPSPANHDGGDAYTESHSSEKIIGRWRRSRGLSEPLQLITKVSGDYSQARMEQALQGSLERLKTSTIDGYFLHRFDPTSCLDEALATMDSFVARGFIKASGWSNFSASQMKLALQLSAERSHTSPAMIEVPYNLVQRDIEDEVLPLAKAHSLTVLAYSPLGAGFLTGKYHRGTTIPHGSRFDVIPGHTDVYFSPENFDLVDRLHAYAREIGIPPVEFALAWVFTQSAINVVLIGARSPQHLATALRARARDFDPAWHTEIASWTQPRP